MTRSSVVGLAEGEDAAAGFGDAAALPGDITFGAGVCASALNARRKLMKDNAVS